MNFDLSEEHNEITDLATKILDDHVTMENLKEVEVSGDWFDRPLWDCLLYTSPSPRDS